MNIQFEAIISRRIEVPPVVDMLDGVKYTLFHRGFSIGEKVIVEENIDHFGNSTFVIKKGFIRCIGMSDVEDKWRLHPRGSIEIEGLAFTKCSSPKRKSILSLITAFSS